MFDKFQQLKRLRKMQAEIKKETATAEENGVRVTVNGQMEVEEVKLNPELANEEQERLVKKVANDAMKKIQEAIRKHIPMGF